MDQLFGTQPRKRVESRDTVEVIWRWALGPLSIERKADKTRSYLYWEYLLNSSHTAININVVILGNRSNQFCFKKPLFNGHWMYSRHCDHAVDKYYFSPSCQRSIAISNIFRWRNWKSPVDLSAVPVSLTPNPISEPAGRLPDSLWKFWGQRPQFAWSLTAGLLRLRVSCFNLSVPQLALW